MTYNNELPQGIAIEQNGCWFDVYRGHRATRLGFHDLQEARKFAKTLRPTPTHRSAQ